MPRVQSGLWDVFSCKNWRNILSIMQFCIMGCVMNELKKRRSRDFKLSKVWSAQGAVGFKQVELGQKMIRGLSQHPTKLVDFFVVNPIVVVLGPKRGAEDIDIEKYDQYVVDRNHLARALLREGYKTAPMEIEADFRDFTYEAFLEKMYKFGYLHPHDENGRLISLTDTPRRIIDLQDDPYRSLAGFVRRAGGFDKDKTPFAEFQWADYFRATIKRKCVVNDFKKAVKNAIELAQLPEACELPGYKGMQL